MNSGVNEPDFDIIICGGGVAGSFLAAALDSLPATQPLKIALIEPHFLATTVSAREYPELRVSALFSGSITALEHLGVDFQAFSSNGGYASPLAAMHVWEDHSLLPGIQPTQASIQFDAAEIGKAQLGWVVENQRLINTLHSRINDTKITVLNQPSRRIVAGNKVSTTIEMADGTTVNGRLLVAADGSNSAIRQQTGIDIERVDYHQRALVASLKLADHHRQIAWQKFLADGPVALLPLAEGYCSLVWSTTVEHAETLESLPLEAFNQELSEALDAKPAVVTWSSPRRSFPLFRQLALRYAGHRTVLIGDAAHRIHPLAGMGANLGIADALALTELLANHTDDPGGQAITRRYDRQRRAEANRYIAAQELLRHCYRWNGRSASLVRGMGMGLLDRSQLLKPELLAYAMGLTDHQPPFFRGERCG